MEVKRRISKRKLKIFLPIKNQTTKKKCLNFSYNFLRLERFCALHLPPFDDFALTTFTIGVVSWSSGESLANRKDRLRQISPERLLVIVTRTNFSRLRNMKSWHENTSIFNILGCKSSFSNQCAHQLQNSILTQVMEGLELRYTKYDYEIRHN